MKAQLNMVREAVLVFNGDVQVGNVFFVEETRRGQAAAETGYLV